MVIGGIMVAGLQEEMERNGELQDFANALPVQGGGDHVSQVFLPVVAPSWLFRSSNCPFHSHFRCEKTVSRQDFSSCSIVYEDIKLYKRNICKNMKIYFSTLGTL